MIPFLDLKAQYAEIRDEVEPAVLDVMANCQYVLGPTVAGFEGAFAEYCGARHCVGVNSGTTALHLALLAAGIQPGDEVITVASTFIATTAAIRYAGAIPVFVDVDPDTWCMDPDAIAAAVTPRTKAVMPVHLHGRVADMTRINAIAADHELTVIEDAAQAHGAEHAGRRAGSFGRAAGFSFYPGKNLGAYGEGGATVTDDDALAHRLRVLRDWGQEEKHHHVVQGYNARMDGIQGAVLAIKLRRLDAWTEARRRHAGRYRALLGDAAFADAGLRLPAPEGPGERHVYHVFSVRVPNRDRVQQALGEAGIGTNIHYPVPVHLQPAHADLGYRAGDLPVSEALAAEFLSLPMFAELTDRQVDQVAEVLKTALEGRG